MRIIPVTELKPGDRVATPDGLADVMSVFTDTPNNFEVRVCFLSPDRSVATNIDYLETETVIRVEKIQK